MTKRLASSLGDVLDRPRLLLVRAGGTGRRLITRGPGRFASALAAVSLVLLVLPAVLNFLLHLVPDSFWRAMLEDEASVGQLWSVRNALAVWAALMTLSWVLKARKRIVVEEIAVVGGEDERLAGRLLDELSRIRALYEGVGDGDASPLSVGVKAMEDLKPGVELGQFLSVSADNLGATLDDVVATKATVPIVGISLPIGTLASIFGRVARGPRLRGVLDHSTLTLELVGGPTPRRWSVQGTDVDAMLAELACRVFNDLSLGGSVRWRAIRRFNEYLELVSESRRVSSLLAAEEKLLDAIAEDPRFGLAYYNLGVVYSLLADAERAALECSEHVGPSDRPLDGYEGRLEAARSAFERASALDRDHVGSVYALAVQRFTHTEALDVDGLVEIAKLCRRAIELDPRHAQAHDLRGMALLALGQARESEQSHRTAVALSRRRLRRAEFAGRAGLSAGADSIPAARADLGAALRNLADVHIVLAQWGDRCAECLASADRLYAEAAKLAHGDAKATTLRAHGDLLERRNEPGRAAEAYAAALRIDPDNPSYSARLASAFAAGPEWQTARAVAGAALDGLAPVYRRTLRPHRSFPMEVLRDSTLTALERTYERLGDRSGDRSGVTRIDEIRRLSEELRTATEAGEVDALRELARSFDEGREWEREQVLLALATTLGRARGAAESEAAYARRWAEAESVYGELLALLEKHRPAGIVEHGVHVGLARALRKCGRREDALQAAATARLLNPLDAATNRELGKAHFALHQLEDALGAWEQALRLAPNDPYLQWRVALCHWSIGRDERDEAARDASFTAAADGFEQAALLFDVRIPEGWAWSRLWAGRARHDLEEHDAALRHLRAAAGYEPTSAIAALLLGEVDLAIGDVHLARARFEAASHAVERRHDKVLDRDWGGTFSGAEVGVRAAVGLGRIDGTAEAARARVAEARSIADAIATPIRRARCEAAIATLEERRTPVLKQVA